MKFLRFASVQQPQWHQARVRAAEGRERRRRGRADGEECLPGDAAREDEERRGQDVIQKLTDNYVAKVESALGEKETDLMAI